MNDITEIFRMAKESLDIRACAEHYGMTVDRHGRGICPFHDDRHPSLSFKGKYFKCFACGEGGDVFKLVGKLTGIDKPVEVLKMLGRDWGISLPLDAKTSPEVIRKTAEERRHYKELEERFRQWSQHTFIVCIKYLKLLRQWRTEYRPRTSDEEINPLFTESLLKLDYMEYLAQKLTLADDDYMREFYVNNRKEVDLIEQRINDYENRQEIS